MFAIGKMQRDVAAIVDVSARELRFTQHRAENFFGDRACNGRHRRNKTIFGEWSHRFKHAARDGALQQALSWISSLAQQWQLSAEFIKQAGETPHCCLIRRVHLSLAAASLHDQVDRTILQMKPPAVRQKPDLRRSRHARLPGADCSESVCRFSVLSLSDASGRT